MQRVARPLWVRAARWLLGSALGFGVLGLGAFVWSRRPVHAELPQREDERFPQAKFPLRLMQGRYLADQAGKPFLIHGESAWSLLVQLNKPEADLYFDDRKKLGVNLVMVNLLEHLYADHAPLNRDGQGPFSTPGDFSTPNEAYFAHADWLIGAARKRGIVVLLCPAYLGFEGGPQGFYREMRQNGPEKLNAYGRFLGKRYRGFDNVIWLEGGDYTPPAADLELVNAVALGIKAEDPDHLHAAHWSPETSGADVPVAGWLDLDTTYTYQATYLRSLIDYGRADGRPHFLIESAYEGERGATARTLRTQAYGALLTGAIGQIYGNRWIWPFATANNLSVLRGRAWTSALDSPGTRSMVHVRALFEPRPWMDLVPDERFRVLVDGVGNRGTPEYALLASTPDGRLAIAYVPEIRPITLDLQKLASPLHERWYDPTNGSFVPALKVPAERPGWWIFQPPGPNSALDPDWLLVIEAG